MKLQSTIESGLVGEGNDKARRQELLAEILSHFRQEGESGVEKVLEKKSSALERDFRAILNQLESKL